MDQVLSAKRVLVTGGAGFIGSNLIESLLFRGNKVVCLYNFSIGKRENLKSFHSNPAFRRSIYAASSSTYCDHPDLPKLELKIGFPLLPYAIIKYTDELFASNYSANYEIETIGLRYFNAFERQQDPDGAYAAVIPKFVKTLMKHEAPELFSYSQCG
jgi:nucleoside-diphosphate-sugar epimerase